MRRTVVQWSGNTQIPWEHTSLIGDFSFNLGQMVVSPQIPYREDVVKDADYKGDGVFGELVEELRSCDFYRQNPAIDSIWHTNPSELDKNQQFIFGRNLLQASAAAFSAQNFMSSLANNLRRYNTQDGNNHVLNGILFEIYFNSHGEFRGGDLKRHYFEEVIALKRNPVFAKSFSFIRTVLAPYKDSLIYFIHEDDAKLDVDISLTEEKVENDLHDMTYSVISLITVNGKDITELVKKHYLYRGISVQEAIAIATNAPIDAVTLHPNMPLLKNITFVKGDEGDLFYL